MKKALQKSKVGPAETDAGGADAPAGDANSSAAAAAAAAEPSDVDADAGAGGSSGAAALRPQGSPAKLPPLGQGGADGATYALTGGTFTLNGSPAHQRGVATFEFEALPDGSQLLVPPPTFLLILLPPLLRSLEILEAQASPRRWLRSLGLPT